MIRFKGYDNLCVGFKKGKVKIFKTQTKKIMVDLKFQTDKITSLIEIIINEIVAVACSSKDRTICIYRSSDGILLNQIQSIPIPSYVRRMTYCLDKKSLLLTNNDGTIVLYNYNQKKIKDLKLRKKDRISDMIYLKDGMTFVFGHSDIEIFNLKG